MTPALRAGLIVSGVAAYPFVTAYLVRAGWSAAVLGLFAALTVYRGFRAHRFIPRLIALGLASALAAGTVFAQDFAARAIPALVYLSLALLFGGTLRHPPSLLERMVRLQFPEFKPGISEYLREWTWIWTLFFAANVPVCLMLAAYPGEGLWAAYTGGIVYGLMGLLGLGELLHRQRRFPDLEFPPALETLKTMIRNGRKIFEELRG